MPNQSNANVAVAIRREATFGTVATSTSTAHVIRIVPSPGLEYKRAVIQSAEMRDDAEEQMGRLGGKMWDGSFNLEWTVGGAMDVLLEALQRSTWATATAVALTSCAFTTNAITQPSGDFVGTSLLRVGDIFRISGSVSGNNDRNIPIVAIGSLTITVPAGTFVTATSTGTLTRIKKLATATTPTNYGHSVEQVDEDVDGSEVFFGGRVCGGRISIQPGQPVRVTFNLMGLDRNVVTGGSSPYFTNTTVTTGLMCVADDSAIYKDGVAVTAFTGLELDFTINAQGVPVIGSLAAADIITNNMRRAGTITALRQDMAALTAFDAETEFSLITIFQEQTSAPKPCGGLYLPRIKYGAVTAPVGGGDGAKIETRQLMVGPQVASTGFDATAATFFSSGAAT